MKRFAGVAACALLLAPAGAGAQRADSFVDVYTVPLTELETSNASSDSGFGVGARGRFAFSPDFFAQGEYQLNAYEGFGAIDADGEATTLRAGAGFLTSGDARVYGLLELLRLDVDIDGSASQGESGYGISLGINGEGDTHLYGQIGFLDVGDVDGLEFLFGGAFRFNPRFGMFVDYRSTRLENDLGAQTNFMDLRVGLRMTFGAD